MESYDYYLELLTLLILFLAAVFLALASGAIVFALMKPEQRTRVVAFLLEGTASQNGKPSISRLQMFIWNIVVAFAFLFILVKNVGVDGALNTAGIEEAFSAIFTGPILVLLGISNGTYVLGKITRQEGASAPPAAPGVTATGEPIRPDAPVG